ncbi:CDP-glycerol glycerophosphotransferase, TagB/SpsB family [Anaerosporobacter mobilis DSM 15930]|jgi:CDP-glycerol glycerophosphotransferase (TagB/SpsB family)|uniref:CDP-glycerol glycerophosphotransferase, TagB/SpsB family n=1 Tax=Anaerosporobacter mobilis DSM 15930 TaxID=1120996 RepID=A0A1M7LP92_9FIRM|nr:CDP-glycerol glycerophosphotransferase family protein [Anaerosporobacter mobilis]SHM79914.1 CDP-glycerol glycerophosphotransferase, TagB/SpsB family [Anaerosporobacter mobilis DSM 15930]
MKNIINNIKYWSQVFLLPIYGLSFLIPRKKDIWLLGSTFGRRFADNPRYFYLYLNQFQNENVKAIWISKNKKVINFLNENGYEAYYARNIKGIWYCLRAKVYLYDNYSKDISFWLSGGAIKINMWHGIPLKKIQMDNVHDKVRHPDNVWNKFKYRLRRLSDEKPSDYVLTTSEELRNIFASAFRTNHVLPIGYPRNDIINSNQIENILDFDEKKYLNTIESRSFSKTLLYMPTFRDSEIKFFDKMDMIDLKEYLKLENVLLLIKLHPKSKLEKEFINLECKNICVIESSLDPYVFLPYADVLITDYSSIYFDYLLLNRPLIFFNYDMKEYLSNSREMYFNYNEVTPGKKVSNWLELKQALENIKNESECNKEQGERNLLKKKMFIEEDGLWSEKLYGEICKIIRI